MTSFISWVDFSSADRERMRRAIALFQEKETRDELGFGTIRDAFADSMFPGTSTIQTRLRYFLFVPWIYKELSESRTPAEAIGARARKRELGLIEPLRTAELGDGVIGARSKLDLKRLPSSIYWAGLHAWGICLYDGSREQYHRDFDRLRSAARAVTDPDDEGVLVERREAWHPKIPAPPRGWPDEISFALTGEEAQFLEGRIAEHCEGSLLDWLVRNGSDVDVDRAWDHPDRRRLPQDLRHELDLARRFSLVSYGAALVYNILLAERCPHRPDWEKDHREALADWASGPEADDLRTFKLTDLDAYLAKQPARVPLRTRDFVARWVERLAAVDPAGIADDADARALVERRERDIKKARSRFANQRGLDQWGGSAGAFRINYRWHIVQRHLRDLHDALR